MLCHLVVPPFLRVDIIFIESSFAHVSLNYACVRIFPGNAFQILKCAQQTLVNVVDANGVGIVKRMVSLVDDLEVEMRRGDKTGIRNTLQQTIVESKNLLSHIQNRDIAQAISRIIVEQNALVNKLSSNNVTMNDIIQSFIRASIGFLQSMIVA